MVYIIEIQYLILSKMVWHQVIVDSYINKKINMLVDIQLMFAFLFVSCREIIFISIFI